jgi:hypothetical protein
LGRLDYSWYHLRLLSCWDGLPLLVDHRGVIILHRTRHDLHGSNSHSIVWNIDVWVGLNRDWDFSVDPDNATSGHPYFVDIIIVFDRIYQGLNVLLAWCLLLLLGLCGVTK